MTYRTGNESEDIAACTNGIRSYKAIVPPQIVTAGNDFIKVVIGRDTYRVKMDYDVTLEAGLEHNYTISF